MTPPKIKNKNRKHLNEQPFIMTFAQTTLVLSNIPQSATKPVINGWPLKGMQ